MSSSFCAGPFMVVLFAKLENMLQNSLYVNILLTGIVAQLACYPQPLLRSFLLNTNMVFQPSVKSLIQVRRRLNADSEQLEARQDYLTSFIAVTKPNKGVKYPNRLFWMCKKIPP